MLHHSPNSKAPNQPRLADKAANSTLSRALISGAHLEHMCPESLAVGCGSQVATVRTPPKRHPQRVFHKPNSRPSRGAPGMWNNPRVAWVERSWNQQICTGTGEATVAANPAVQPVR